MALRLKTKITLVTAVLVLAVVTLFLFIDAATLMRQVIAEADDRARFIATQILRQAQRSLVDAAQDGKAPNSSSPSDVRAYVRDTLENDASFTALVDSSVGFSFLIYEVSVAQSDGIVLFSSSASLPGRPVLPRPRLDELAHAGFLDQLRILFGPQRSYVVVLPFDLGGEPFGETRVTVQTGLMRTEVLPDLRRAGGLALAAIFIATVLAGVVSSAALAPLARISAQLDEIAGTEPDLPAEPEGRRDEFGQVSQKITRIGRMLREERQIERLRMQSAIARVTAGVAHEVKNPLNSMRLWAENLKGAMPRENGVAGEALRVLDSEIDRLDRVVKRMLDFYRPQELQFVETDLGELLRDVFAVVNPQMERARVEGSMEIEEGVPRVRGDRSMLQQAVLNLVVNAIEAMPEGGRLTLALARKGPCAEIRVADTGCGIAPENRAKVFQLFFTTRPEGSGIGLANAYKTVQLHNGSIDFESEVGRGTTFRVELPLLR